MPQINIKSRTKRHRRTSGEKDKDSKKNEEIQTIDFTLKNFADAQVAGGTKPCKATRKLTGRGIKYAQKEGGEGGSDDEDLEKMSAINVSESLSQSKDNEALQNEAMETSSNAHYLIPMEIWYKISQYISLRDIKSFALISPRTRSVVNSKAFWLRLYKRYAAPRHILPPELGLRIFDQKEGLRARVVRSIFYNPMEPSKNCNNYDKILGKVCVSTWIRNKTDKEGTKTRWLYAFKFGPIKLERKFRTKEIKTLSINRNPEEGNTVLHVYADNYCYIEPVFGGLKLRKIKHNPLTSTVSLEFGPAHFPTKSEIAPTHIYLYRTTEGPPNVYDWWHPPFYE